MEKKMLPAIFLLHVPPHFFNNIPRSLNSRLWLLRQDEVVPDNREYPLIPSNRRNSSLQLVWNELDKLVTARKIRDTFQPKNVSVFFSYISFILIKSFHNLFPDRRG